MFSFSFQLDGSCKMIATLAGHSGQVTSVRWVRRQNEPERELISAADDCAIYWNITDLDHPKKFILSQQKNGVSVVDAIYENKEITIATASADLTVRLWRFNPDEQAEETINSFQVFDLRNGICFCVKLVSIQTAGMLLAYATDDDKIHLFGENHSRCFEKLETLEGHEDWVRGLDFTVDTNGDVLMASSSQDTFIRIWRFSPATNAIKQEENFIQVEERTFTFGNKKFILSLESVLQGHENWVYSVCWSRNEDKNSLQLLSSSMDKTMIVWAFDKEQNLWIENIRVGDVGGNR